MAQYRYFKEWRKNPQWSFSCCLAIFLSFSDLQGDISDLVDTDVVKSQQHSEEMEMLTILSAIEESKAINFKGNRGDRGDETKKVSTKKRHQGTQTEITILVGQMA